MIAIAFGHRKFVGKSTAGRFLASHLRVNRKVSHIETRGFADKGKDICHDLYGWAGLKTRHYYEEHPNEKDVIIPKLGKSARQIWIDFLSGVGRRVYENTWCDYLFNTVNCDLLIITDLRFPNECELIKANNGFVIKINRPDIEHTPDEADDPLESYDAWSHTFTNQGPLSNLHGQIVKLAEDLFP